jgi:hypothetical protein
VRKNGLLACHRNAPDSPASRTQNWPLLKLLAPRSRRVVLNNRLSSAEPCLNVIPRIIEPRRGALLPCISAFSYVPL